MKFKSDIEVQAGLKDSSGALGLSGQILSSTSGNVSWVTPTVNTVARDVQNEVKAGVAINKGQAVYVTGADGTNIIVGLASNVSEATSSKTLGLLNATVAVNGFADVVQIGRLSGLNTLGAVAGDPVWLGTGGNLIYGLINKPYAPANLVFIGIVTRVNVNNGEIFVSVQNGFELNEIHDVDLKTTVPINGDILGFNGTLWVNKTIAQWLGYTPANASGTTNYVSKFTGTTTLGNSQIFDNGTNVGIGTSSPTAKLSIGGVGSALSFDTLGAPGTTEIKTIQDYELSIKNNRGTSTEILVGNEILKFSTSESERMRITAAGNVGIGTSAPGSKLDVNGDIGYLAESAIYPRQKSVASDWYLGKFDGGSRINNSLGSSGDNAFQIGYYGGGTFAPNIKLSAGGGNSSYINSGNLGIGTNSPVVSLQVKGNDGYGTQFVLEDSLYPNTYFYQGYNGLSKVAKLGTTDSAGIITFAPGNNESVRFLANGNVGIGTSSPNFKLEVNGSVHVGNSSASASGFSNAMEIVNTASSPTSLFLYQLGIGSGHIGLRSNDSNLYIVNSYTDGSITNSSAITLTPSGSVGIGNTSPSFKLDVNGTGRFTQNQNGITSVITQNNDLTNGAGQALRFYFDGSTPIGGVFHQYNTSTFAYDLALQVWSGTAATNRLNISGSTGNVGIGTTNPTYKLQVVNSGNTLLQLNGNNTAGTIDTGFTISADDSKNIYLYQRENASTVFGTNNTERMRITAAGNVGIGTSSPTYPLDVYNTGASTARIRVVGTSNFALFQAQNTSGTFYMGIDDSTGSGFAQGNYTRVIYSSSSYPLAITVNDAERMRIATTGAVKFNSYGSGSFTGTATQKLAVDSSGNIIEIPIGAGPVDGSGTTNYVTKWTDSDTIGNSQLFDNGSGFLGLGTATAIGNSTNKVFKVEGSDSANLVLTQTGGVTGALTSFGGELNLSTSTNHPLWFGTNGTEKVRITASGNVGIGTSSPAYKFNVVTNAISGRQNLAAIDRTAGNLVTFTNPEYSVDASMGLMLRVFPQNDSRQGAGIIASGGGLNGETDLSLFVSSGSGFSTSYGALNIKGATGYVGIGTTNPLLNLQINSATGTNSTVAFSVNNTLTWYNRHNASTGSFEIVDVVNTTPRLVIQNNGNVGIGTTSPSEKLTVQGTIAVSGNGVIGQGSIYGTPGNSSYGTIHLYNGATGNTIINNQSYGIDLHTAGSSKMYITQAGNVGIGTGTPNTILSVVKTETFNGYTDFVQLADNTNGLRISDYWDSSGIRWDLRRGTTPMMSFSQGNNVGIGTTSPLRKLHVAGDFAVNANGSQYYGVYIPANGEGANPTILVGDWWNASGNLTWDSSNKVFNINSLYGSSAAPITFSGNSAERMRITAAGNVGIGTSSPYTKLDVRNGTFAVTSSDFASGTTGSIISILLGASTGNTYSTIQAGINGNSAVGNLVLQEYGGNVGIGTTTPTQKLDVVGNAKVSGSVQVGDDSATASATNVGATRYRSDANNSYMDMVMQTGSGVYAWVNVVQNTWI